MRVLSELGQNIIPEIFDALQEEGLGELLDVLADTTVKDERGAVVKSAATAIYSNISIPPLRKNKTGNRLSVGDKPMSYGNYLMVIPTKQNGVRVNLNADHRLRIQARDLEPEKTFSIESIFENNGVTYEVEAKKE